MVDMEKVADIERHDFFAQNKRNFYKKFSHKSILCQGSHWDTPPMVTILITTYKRPKLLREALSSAINQKGFEDYQIIIADNEGRPIEEETPTAKVVKEYQDEKVIYYRHSEEVVYKMDSAIRLAKSPWIVILHDDDILAENHLRIMTGIVRKYREIKFLGCTIKDYFGTEKELKKDKNRNGNGKYTIGKYVKDAVCFGYWPGWLGALISRKHYIAVGGMPSISMGCGDKAMVVKIWNRFDAYVCHSEVPLYYYRRSTQQISYTQKDIWEEVLVNEFYFSKYVIKRYHRLTHRLWEKAAIYYILERCEEYNNGLYHTVIDPQRLCQECNVSENLWNNNCFYYFIRLWLALYRKYIQMINDVNVRLLGRTDIYLTI